MRPTPAGVTPVPGGVLPGFGTVPATIGKYQIVERVGTGGFAAVFKAWDPDIKRFVAVKACTLGPEMHARFFQGGGARRPAPASEHHDRVRVRPRR
jgi:hypothetical protein